MSAAPSSGGVRPSAGRPAANPDRPRSRKWSIRVAEAHLDVLDQIRDHHGLGSRTDALVYVIERAEEAISSPD